MKYTITDILNNQYQLDLPVSDDITWEDFLQLKAVRDLDITITDITPEGMPDRFTDEERWQRQLSNMGLKKSRDSQGAPIYQEDQDSQTDCD